MAITQRDENLIWDIFTRLMKYQPSLMNLGLIFKECLFKFGSIFWIYNVRIISLLFGWKIKVLQQRVSKSKNFFLTSCNTV